MGRSIALFCLTVVLVIQPATASEGSGQASQRAGQQADQQPDQQTQPANRQDDLARAANAARMVAESSISPNTTPSASAKPSTGSKLNTSTKPNKGTNANADITFVPQVVVTPPTSPPTSPATSVATLNDLRSIGGLSLFFDQKNSQFALNSPLSTLIARYRFPGTPDSQEYYSDLVPPQPGSDKSSVPALPVPVPVTLPDDANMFEVQFVWCDSGHPCATLPVGYQDAGCPPTPTKEGCAINVIYLRDLFEPTEPGGTTGNLIPAFILFPNNLLVSETLLKDSSKSTFPTYTINGFSLLDLAKDYNSRMQLVTPALATGAVTYAMRSGWTSIAFYHFERYPAAVSCHPYKDEDPKDTMDATRPGYKPPNLGKDNGIIPLEPKVYDVFTLRQMLATTASQLAGISGFTQANITAAFGNLQGVTTESSFINAQATTAATPSVASTVQSGVSSGNTVGNAGVTCGAGTLLGTNASGQPTCLPSTGTTVTGAGSTTGGSNTITSGTTGSNSTTTNSGGLAGTVAPVLTPIVPTAPTNIGVSASDILTEQVELNSQITSLRLALQGALSDQYLVKNGKTLGTRQQTTLGFNISLDPPRRYKHAVAEVKVWVFPARPGDDISVVNLLPTAKTYNVAKITSNQKQFGAGVVIDAINVGASGGKSKNRLYLAKDTDTLAVQYFPDKYGPPTENWPDRRRYAKGAVPAPPAKKPDIWPYGATPIGRSPQEHVIDFAHKIEAWQAVQSACNDDPTPTLVHADPQNADNPQVFGWQFRPVLGADYVQGGIRTVYAQLGLPVALGMQYAPQVYIQTLWRDYDEKKQVVGAVYAGSCSIVEETSAIELVSPLKVHSVAVDDMGGGVLKVSAHGEFLAQGFSVLSGQSTVGPTTFDGNNIQFFGNAASLLMTDDLNLLAEDGKLTAIGMKPIVGDDPNGCSITSAELRATPRPDGNSMVEATIKSGSRFDPDPRKDGPLKPLILIGTQVYGLHETPFLEQPDRACRPRRWDNGYVCTYHFLASTDVLHSAESFTVRDLAWIQPRKSGKIDFDPSFTSLALLASNPTPPPDNTAPPAVKPAHGAPPPPPSTPAKPSAPGVQPVYTLTGHDLLQRGLRDNPNCVRGYFNCLQVFEGLTLFQLTNDSFQVASKTNAVIELNPPTPAPFVSLVKVTTTDKAHKTTTVQRAALGDSNNTATIYFTKDGLSDPDPTQSDGGKTVIYDAPLPLSPLKLRAIAVSSGQITSEVSAAKIVKGSDGKFLIVTTSSTPASQLVYKSYRFVWHPAYGAPVEWDLPVPQTTPPAITASAILNQSDSTEVTFNNVQVLASSIAYPITFTFDGVVLNPAPVFKYDPIAMTVKILITSTMTLKPGHKELLLNGYTMASGASTPTAVQIELPFDVTRR